MCGGACYCSQAEDGIRDLIVTGVQTCALPIWLYRLIQSMRQKSSGFDALQHPNSKLRTTLSNHRGRLCSRSAERRVGKECRSRWSPYHSKERQEHAERRSKSLQTPARTTKRDG